MGGDVSGNFVAVIMIKLPLLLNIYKLNEPPSTRF
jgi:hypothetical protein